MSCAGSFPQSANSLRGEPWLASALLGARIAAGERHEPVEKRWRPAGGRSSRRRAFPVVGHFSLETAVDA